jgi:hypothetical protein
VILVLRAVDVNFSPIIHHAVTRCGQPARKRRRNRPTLVQLSRGLAATVLDVGPELTLA